MKCEESEEEPESKSTEKFYQLSCFIEKGKMVIADKLKSVCTSPCFSAVFAKEDNFASLDDRTVTKWDLLLNKRIFSLGSKFFPLRVDPS